MIDTNDSKDIREGKGNPYFFYIPLPLTHKHSFSSSRSLPHLPYAFNQSIYNNQTDS